MARWTASSPGSPPGTLQPQPQTGGSGSTPPLRVRCHLFDGDSYRCETVADPVAASELAKGVKCWIDIQGEPDTEALQQLQENFHLHPLALEDLFSPATRPKVEAFEEQLFILLDTVMIEKESLLQFQKFALFVEDNLLITLLPGGNADFLQPIYQRIQAPGTRLRNRGPGYLAYCLVDLVVDHYFLPLEAFGDTLEALEETILESADREDLGKLNVLKRNLLRLRHRAWPTRELINSLIRDESPWIGQETKLYLRDCYEHIVQIIEILENYRDLAGGLVDLYLSSASSRTNDIVKVLTIISAIFIPLTFIAGVYGMNFNPQAGRWNMPELNQPYGYVACLAAMLLIVLVQLVIFKKKRWF